MQTYHRILVTSLIALTLIVGCEGVEATPTPLPPASQVPTAPRLANAATVFPTATPVPEPTVTPEMLATVPPSSLQITYVGITSFLISAGDKKILVDAHVMSIPAEVQRAIKEAQPPFDEIDLVLVTHEHSDHFDRRLVRAHLESNPNALFASTDQVTKDLLAISPDLARDRVRSFEPEEGERISVTLNGIDLEVLNLPHGVPVTNLGFIVRLGDWKLLHTGDISGDAALRAYGLADEDIDVAFVPYFFLIDQEFLTEDGQSKVLQAIQARQIVPMHLPRAPSEWGSVFRALATRYPESIRFREVMETRVLQEILAPEMVLVAAGSFQMGSTEGLEDQVPVHTVHITRPFYVSKYEVTQAQYLRFCADTPGAKRPQDLGWGSGPQHSFAVVWYDAVKFCNWLSEKEGLIPCYSGKGRLTQCDFSANGYRLPTEAEWEYAARGGHLSQGFQYAGSDDVDPVAWYLGNSGAQIHPVGQKQPNELGLYDMSGNAWEWCWDWYGSAYYASSLASDPTGPSSGTERVRRGGCFMNNAEAVRSAFRSSDVADYRFPVAGFRVVRNAS